MGISNAGQEQERAVGADGQPVSRAGGAVGGDHDDALASQITIVLVLRTSVLEHGIMAQKLTRRAVLMQAVFVAAMGTGCHNAGETPPCAKEDVLETTVSKVAGAKDQRQATFNGEAHGRWNSNCNCVVNSGMTVTFWDTGRGEWECDVETYDTNPSGDSTVTISLSVFDSAGILLFTTAGYASPE